MSKKHVVLGAGLVATLAYLTRRTWIGRWLGLPPARHAVVVESGIRIVMPDGVALAADHYYPKGRGTYPTVLMRTPYGRNLRGAVIGLVNMFSAQRFAERGYHVIVQDTRGRFDSEGEFEPFVHEVQDGRATLEWIARQPWFDGHLGMWGQSYGGYVQWAVAADAPDYLQAIVPCNAGSRLTPYTGSAFALDTMVRWIDNLHPRGSLLQQLAFATIRHLNPQIQNRRLAPAFAHVPIAESDELLLGRPVPYFRKWMEHAHEDAPFWVSTRRGTQMERVRAATHFVSGWYDILLHELLDDYQALAAAGRAPYLTIGPRRHLDAAGAGEAVRVGIAWFDAKLKARPARLRGMPVRLYLMGADAWREYESWPPPARATRWYLHENARLELASPPADSKADLYRYDPSNPTPSVGGPVYHQGGGAQDNRRLESRPDVLCYTTDPLDRDIDVIGWVSVELYAASSLAYADFFGRVCDVYADGRSFNICDGLVRLEPGSGDRLPDGSYRIRLDLWATAHRFLRGHRIRLQVSSGAHPRFNRNLGTGEPMATATKMLPADQTVYHDSAHPSALVLPVAAIGRSVGPRGG